MNRLENMQQELLRVIKNGKMYNLTISTRDQLKVIITNIYKNNSVIVKHNLCKQSLNYLSTRQGFKISKHSKGYKMIEYIKEVK